MEAAPHGVQQDERLVGCVRIHEGTVYSLDATYAPLESRPMSRRQVTKRAVMPELQSAGIILVSGSHDQTICISSVTKSRDKEVQVNREKLLAGHTADVYALELVPLPEATDQVHVGDLVSGGDYTVRTWDTKRGEILATFQGHTGYVSCLKIRGRRVFSGSWDTTIRSWNLETGKAMHVFKGHTNIVNCLDATDTDLFSGSWDSTIIRWRRATGEVVTRFEGHTDGVQCLQYHNDAIISGSMDKTIRVWSLKSGKATHVLRGHTGGVECLNAYQRLCFSGSYDKIIRCYNLETGECVAIFRGHTDGVYSVRYFGGLLFSGSGDKTIRIWNAAGLFEPERLSWFHRLLFFFKRPKN
ncbi:WD40-repeat-containing domain protein [Zopfochytrium polystomum]|nr:WD40-repeat-containing domain protein [Zopfochytrium polystomum]